ncbi:prepilin-type N-terminal cleavage/methylation domain-containing protein [Caballeronia arationis]|jgi:type IV pilus assembly protein PilE|uniref:Prepilin-type N-terminal cleavage/methylation domain-containing protein n=1 Tax=Caballeronia arationis TaxID=1777142 RepID=A0A7Z7ICD0_9BURK|nr:type IV pilin protein [Caballeronia arationis]SOE82580.1 prepilin-type N-terminal cleavage/methylation domain-containing protein [Caballeronia arationis]
MNLTCTRRAGFTLLELMIALGVVAIIATFAIPAYRGHVAKAHRMEASAALYRAAQFIETARAAQSSPNADVPSLPAGFDQAPANGTPVYRLRAIAESATNGGYAIEAEPVAPGAMQDDACGVFVIDATGARSNRAPASAAPVDATVCWSGR